MPGLIPDNEQNKEAVFIAVRENKSINPLACDVYSSTDANLLNPSTCLRDLQKVSAVSFETLPVFPRVFVSFARLLTSH